MSAPVAAGEEGVTGTTEAPPESVDAPTADVTEHVLDELDRQSIAEDVADLVLAAMLGDQALAEALGGTRPTRPEPMSREVGSTGIYLKSIAAEGFRGVGPRTELRLDPHPGLTLIVGRNGSGKSSFAEAAEIAITGRSSRLDRSKVWHEGWANLHHSTHGVHLEMVEEGTGVPLAVKGRWAAGAKLADVVVSVRRQGEKAPLATLGWGTSLENYRPLLSYAELGDAVSGKPTELHDALWSILGLQEIETARKRLSDRVSELNALSGAVKQEGQRLAQQMSEIEDVRARRAAELVSSASPDLDTLESLATGQLDPPDPRMDGWRAVAGARFPTAESVLEAVHAVEEAAAAAQGTQSELGASSLRLAEILERAATHVDASGPLPCPLCGVTELDHAWSAGAHARAEELRESAKAVHEARTRLRTSQESLSRHCATASPASLFESSHPQIASRLTTWHGLAVTTSSEGTPDRILDLVEELERDVSVARSIATSEVRAHEDRWRPAASQLAAWVSHARNAAPARARLPALRKANRWLKDEAEKLRDIRIQPFAEASTRIWEQLRQESNVAVDQIRLRGAGPRRHLAVDVAVDGVVATDGSAGAALGVMSQGELSALGLALFIPRATHDASPFRFLVLDDPVQSMDPAKVDGLARVLEAAARTRQVVVFTHDERLQEAVTRLAIAATVWEVVRRPRSVVEVRKVTDAVTRYLDDARAIARSDKLPGNARSLVVAGFLRSAIEAAALDRARRRMTSLGMTRDAMLQALDGADSTNEILALAMFDDTRRGNEVLGRLNRWGSRQADAYRFCKETVHASDAPALSTNQLFYEVKSVEKLTERLSRP